MAQPKEVHCPFCHHKELFHDAPVRSTVRCRNCKSIFRMPAEGVKRGEKVKKFKARRHSPAYYVILLLLIGGGLFAWMQVRQYLEARQERLQDIWLKLEDPFAKKVKYPPNSAGGVLERFLECWKQGENKSPETGDYTGFECMLLYVLEEDLKAEKHGGKLESVVKDFKKRFGTVKGSMELKSYKLKGKFKESSPTILRLEAKITGETSGGFVQKHGEMPAFLSYADHTAFSRAQHLRDNPDTNDNEPQDIKMKKTWGVCFKKIKPIWD